MQLKVGALTTLKGKKWVVTGTARSIYTELSTKDLVLSDYVSTNYVTYIHTELSPVRLGEIYTVEYEYLDFKLFPYDYKTWMRVYTYYKIYKGEKKANDQQGTTSGAHQASDGKTQGGGEGNQDGTSTGGSGISSADSALYQDGRGREEGDVVHTSGGQGLQHATSVDGDSDATRRGSNQSDQGSSTSGNCGDVL